MRVKSPEKTVLIVSSYFPPSNLTGGHRARLFSSYLAEFGWEPIVLTVMPECYEGPLDHELEKLVRGDVVVIRTGALPTRPLRLVGDIGLRSLWSQYRELGRIIEHYRPDLLYITIPSNFSALLGPLVRKRYGLPYAIDYQDPWVHRWPGTDVPLTKAWASYNLSRLLEPVVLRNASFITSVAPGYYESILERYGWMDEGKCHPIPLGVDEHDFAFLEENPRKPFLFDPDDGNVHFVYTGAMLPRAYSTLDALFKALHTLRRVDAGLLKKLRIHFIGTGKDPSDPGGYNIAPLAEREGLGDIIDEHPARISFLDSLNHLKHSSVQLLLGSSEPHYTPSKLFLYLMSGRPIMALLHAESESVGILNESGAGVAVTFDERAPAAQKITGIADGIREAAGWSDPDGRRRAEVASRYTARAMTSVLAGVLDEFYHDSRG